MLNILAIIGLLLLLWLTGETGYVIYIAIRQRKWTASLQRNEQQVRHGCEAYTQGSGSEAILFVHGFADSPVLFNRMIPWFCSQGYACRAMRLPGFAQPAGHQTSITLTCWLEALSREYSLLQATHQRVWVVAHSLGATITANWLRQSAGPPPAGVVLLAPLIDVSTSRSFLLSPRTWFELAQRLLLRVRIVENALPIDTCDPHVEATHPRDRFIHVAVYRALFHAIDHLSQAPLHTDIPFLILLAQHDHVVSNQAAERFFLQSDIPDLQQITLQHSGHVIPLDPEWEDASRHILAFIQKIRITTPREYTNRTTTI